jgi:hypothetical protein
VLTSLHGQGSFRRFDDATKALEWLHGRTPAQDSVVRDE